MNEKSNQMKEHYKNLINDAIKELKTPGKRHRQIPNILTTLRLFAPITIIPAVALGNYPLTILLAGAFSITDLVDGFIARHWNLTSELGKDLDALADKMFSGTLLLGASLTNPILLMNVALEMIIARINIHQKKLGKETASTLMGKGKTWALFALAGLGIAVPSLANTALLNALSIITASLQALTVGSYIKQYEEDWTDDTNTQPQTSSKKQTIKEKEPHHEKTNSKIIEFKGNGTSIKEETTQSEKLEDFVQSEQPESSSNEETLEQLRQMSEFLHQEKNNQLGITTTDDTDEKTTNFQKVKA